MLRYVCIILCLLCPLKVEAGVDFSMMGREKVYTIPEFKSKEDALDWANRSKWIEPQRRQLEGYVARIGRLYDMEEDKRQRIFFYHQWERASLALKIISNYKRLGIKGDDAMVGSSVYIGMTPLKRK